MIARIARHLQSNGLQGANAVTRRCLKSAARWSWQILCGFRFDNPKIRPRSPCCPWRDVAKKSCGGISSALSPLETAHELALSWPWLAISLYAAAHRHHAVALACSFMFFLTGLRQVHGAFHYSIGLSRRWTESTMFVLSVAMLGSMHAVQINHLRHHRHCLEDEDIEAMSARMPVWKAIVTGPLFPWRLHRKALQVATRPQRRRIAAELCATALMFVAAAAGFPTGCSTACWR